MFTKRADLARDAVLYAASKAIPGLLTLLSVVAFARLLSAESYGTYALLFSIASLIGTLASSWIAQSILRFTSVRDDSPRNLDAAATKGFYASILAAVAVFLLFVFAASSRSGFRITTLDVLLVSILIFFTAAYAIKYAQLQALIAPSRVVVLETLRSGFALVGGVLLLWLFGPHHELVLLALIVSLIASTLIVFSRHGSGPGSPLVWNAESVRGDLRTMFHYGWPLSCWMGCIALLSVGDRYLIQHYFGIASVGPYAATYDLVVRGFALYAFPITLAVHPRIMAAHNSGLIHDARRLRNWAIVAQLGVAVPAFVMLWLIQEFLVVDLLKQDRQLISLVLPLAVGGFVWQLALLIHKPLELRRATRSMLLIAIVSVLCALLFNYVLLPRHGIIAAAHAYLLSGFLYCALVEIASRTDRPVQ